MSAGLHDPAVAVLDPDGLPLFAEANERYLQNKRAYNCPADDLIRLPRLIHELCPSDAELKVAVGWSDSMLQKLNMALWGLEATSVPRVYQDDEFGWPMPGAEMMLVGFRNSLSQAGINLKASARIPNKVVLNRYDHHLCHAALAAYTSPFEECSVAVIDGYGEDRSTSFFSFEGGILRPVPGQPWDSQTEMRQFVSLGHFYSRVCAACGFDPVQGEEWKVMGLAAYGSVDSCIKKILRSFVEVRGLGLRSACADDEFGDNLKKLRALERKPGRPAIDVADLAASGQSVFEDLVTELLFELHKAAPSENLVLAGGCGLNSSCNGRILDSTPFQHLHVPSAPADDGCALGAAILAFCEDHPGSRPPAAISSPYLGSTLAPFSLENLERFGRLGDIGRTESALLDEVAGLLSDGKIVGWLQGRAEFGPRALGHRSILADPRRADMKDRLNSVVKFREEFRPFAPSILDDHGAEYFESYQSSRYMERTLRFRQDKAGLVPAVVHADGTGRLQSVRRDWTPLFHDLIQKFYEKTGIPLVLNTSLNVMGRPIVHTLEDALGLFFTTGLDAIVIEQFLVKKTSLPDARQ